MIEFCDKSSHTHSHFSHSLSYHYFSNRVFSRAHCFSLDCNRTLFALFPLLFRKQSELFIQPTRCLNTFEITTLLDEIKCLRQTARSEQERSDSSMKASGVSRGVKNHAAKGSTVTGLLQRSVWVSLP